MDLRRCDIMRKFVFGFLISAVAGCVSIRPLVAQERSKEAVPAYRNPSLPIEQRVEDLVSRMTLEEKVLQMQHTAPAIPRLGIPSYDWWSEALHGVARAGYATVFPQAIGMAATWDREPGAPRGRDDRHRGARQVQPGAARREPQHLSTGSISGRPTSTSSAIPAGGAGRRPTAKIPSSPPSWGWRS